MLALNLTVGVVFLVILFIFIRYAVQESKKLEPRKGKKRSLKEIKKGYGRSYGYRK